ncbi:hypothetical protein BXU06_15330 [Aquaspirillum sp. LM1]|uniref:P-loop NTPase fold protein n=1 Tax=Aquaspirillum sp. LM1 TaxID=1938604 RepID=UPI000983E2BA|nr:P-loop NTPase fold protein [Aquaspirillum sp. LM1]AQR66264.1 hypothetical protein BXU06_15330 [Aquaspirillum sp. LM1]
MAEHSGTNTLAFGHAQLAKAVVKRIQRHFRTDATRRSAVEQSLVVGVFGEWGSGKSSLLHAVKQDFDNQPDEAAPVVTVFFNAWRYEKEPHLIVPLLKTIQAEIKRATPTSSQENLPITGQEDTSNTHLSLFERFKEKLSKGSQLFGDAAKAFAQVAHEATITFKQPGIPVEVSLKTSPKAAVELFRSSQDKKDEKKDNSAPDPSHYAKLDEYDTLYLEFERQLRELTDSDPALNLLFFIDDLDRCLPEKALEMLEAIKLFFDVPRCVFVLAVDDEVVERGVQHRYRDYLFEASKAASADASHRLPITGAEYLEKIIHLPLRLPPAQTGQAEQFLRERYPELFDHQASYHKHQVFTQQAYKEEEEARQKVKYHRDVLNMNRQYNTTQEMLLETSARDYAQQHLEHAQQKRDLCRLFVSAVPPVPRKLQRAAELFHMLLDASQQLGMGIDQQPSKVMLLARLAIWQCFAPELFRLCRRQPSRFLRIAQWFAASQQDFYIINAEEHIEKDIYGESRGDALIELKNLRRSVAASHNQRSEFDLKALFIAYPSDILPNQTSAEEEKLDVPIWQNTDELRKLAQFGIDMSIDEIILTKYDTTETLFPNAIYGHVADELEFFKLLFSKNLADQQDALTHRLQGGLLPPPLFYKALKNPKLQHQTPEWLARLIKYLTPEDAENLPPIQPDLSAIVWHLRRPRFSSKGDTALIPEQNGTAKLWNIHTGALIRSFNGHNDGFMCCAFSHKQDVILTGSHDKTAKLWDLNNGELIKTFSDHAHHVIGCAFSVNDQNIFTVDSKPGKIKIWDRKTGAQLREINIGQNHISACDFSPDRTAAVTTYYGLTATLWNIETGTIIHELKGHTKTISDCQFSLDGKTILTVSYDSTAKLWDTSTGALLNSIEIYSPQYNLSCASSPDGKKFITGHSVESAESNKLIDPPVTCCATLWDSEKRESIFIFQHRGSDVFGAFSNDGARIITTSIDNTAKIWSAKTGEQLKSLAGLYESISCCIFSPTGKNILTADELYSFILWDIASGELIKKYVDHKMQATARHCAFSPDGKSILINSTGNAGVSSHASLWDIQTGTRSLSFFGHSGYITNVAFSPNGEYILTSSSDHTAKLFDSQSGEELQSYKGHSSIVCSCAFSPDGQQVLTSSTDHTAKLWNRHTGELIHTFEGHTSLVHSCSFSPDGRMVLTSSFDGTIRLWDAQTGKQFKLLFEFGSLTPRNQASFSPNNRTVIFAEKYTAILLDTQTGNVLHRLQHASWINSSAFSPDGVYAITGSADGTAKLWDVHTGTLLRTFFTSQVDNIAFSWPASPQDFINNGCVLRKLNNKQDIDWEKPLNWIIQDKYLKEQQPIRTWPLIKLITRYGDQTSRQLLPASAQSTTETKQSAQSVWGWPPSTVMHDIAKLR